MKEQIKARLKRAQAEREQLYRAREQAVAQAQQLAAFINQVEGAIHVLEQLLEPPADAGQAPEDDG